ncbi:condensation domain-containing protein, partial [Rhizohabitans arisaemae]|uniref:condensation domain-containing protein n=1 Tax=Rhizohabitans arisaemae TaxID=2720610 RepID=UPI0024B1C8FD
MTAQPEATEVEDAYPLTALQAGMLFHSAYETGSATYHDVFTLTLRAPYDSVALRGVLDELSVRHPVLRTSFDLTGFSEPLQLVWSRAQAPIEVHDLRGLDAGTVAQRIRAFRDEEKTKPFDWGSAPLLRVVVHLRDDAEFALTLSFHHAILDGWSVASLTTELVGRYSLRVTGGATPPLTGPDLSFRDHVARERAAVASPEAGAFWERTLEDAPVSALPRLPGYRSGDAEDVTASLTPLDPETVAGLERTARERRVPLRTVFLACHLRVLGLLTGEREVISGMVTHGRPEHEAAEEVLGLFLNSVPVRADLNTPSWNELIDQVFATELAILPHRLYPLFEMQRLTGRSPLFDVLFDYRDFHVYKGLNTADGIALGPSEFFEQTNIALTTGVIRFPATGELALQIRYDRTQFPADWIAGMAGHYLKAFAEVAKDPAMDPRAFTDHLAEDSASIERWNSTAVDHPGGTLPALVAAQAAA